MTHRCTLRIMTTGAPAAGLFAASMHRDRLRRAAEAAAERGGRRAADHALARLRLPARVLTPRRSSGSPAWCVPADGEPVARAAAPRGAAGAPRARRARRRDRDRAWDETDDPIRLVQALVGRRAAGRGPGPDVGALRASPAARRSTRPSWSPAGPTMSGLRRDQEPRRGRPPAGGGGRRRRGHAARSPRSGCRDGPRRRSAATSASC